MCQNPLHLFQKKKNLDTILNAIAISLMTRINVE